VERIFVVCALLLVSTLSRAADPYDGTWRTKLTCPAKGSTQGYIWLIPSFIQGSQFRGEHGTAGEPGYLLIVGKISADGNAKLSANGLVASRKYARGIFTTKGDEYSYDIKAHFNSTDGTGTKGAGLGIVGRECTFEFTKQETPTGLTP